MDRWTSAAAKLLGALCCSALLFPVGVLPVSSSARGRELSPAELLAAGLPRRVNLQKATKSQVLGAVCFALRQRSNVASAITSIAVAAHRDYAAEIVGTVLRCSGKVDCDFVGEVVKAASAVDSDSATAISDAAIAKAPDCAERIRKAGRHEGKTAEETAAPEASPADKPIIGTSAGPDEGFDPHEELQLICDDGTQRAVRESLVEEFLRTHPGSVVGHCEPSPTTNR